jgi:tyrosyl-tRNA synthetase
MPELTLATEAKGLAIAPLLKQAGLAPSISEAVRNIEQGGVKVDGEKVSDRALHLAPGTYVLQVGKRKWARVTLA